tara:strand:+ start:519 stop:836 length:318 start_codon:yes stop_codon:yes gene_type:complete
MDIINYYKYLLDYSRKAKRSEYIIVSFGILSLVAIGAILGSQGFSEDALMFIMVILYLLWIPISITTTIARCHDLGWSGWYILWSFIPIANLIFGICLLALPSKE